MADAQNKEGFEITHSAPVTRSGGASSSNSVPGEGEMKLEPSSPTERYAFSRCSSTGSINTPSSSAHNTEKQPAGRRLKITLKMHQITAMLHSLAFYCMLYVTSLHTCAM
ncbi:uncharacterized protein LOC117168900 isoform X2 [Belonocnema kinseyi]|uniref:uncharacterized protein LOC117168900 isoform X2 n=1 Tax=Belonocnema kinseyi TaxID=2817044 RepID=UPI00143CF98B|nr:uncharacterized protein LOC117168900 isoform X2 [Belonocnema kinseyi]